MFGISGVYICVTGIQKNILWLGKQRSTSSSLSGRAQLSSPFSHNCDGTKELKGIFIQFRIRMGCGMESFGYSGKRARTSAIGHCCVPRLPGSVVK